MPDTSVKDRRRAILAIGITMVAVIVGLIVIAVPLGNSGTGGDRVVVAGHPLLNKPAPEIDLETLDGERVVLSELRGRPVLLNFWATWCIPCREEFPLLVQAYGAHREEGLEILGIVHDDSADGARQFAADRDATWPMPFDADDVAWNDYVGIGMPTSFFVDRAGVVRAFSLGGFSEESLIAQLEMILPEA